MCQKLPFIAENMQRKLFQELSVHKRLIKRFQYNSSWSRSIKINKLHPKVEIECVLEERKNLVYDMGYPDIEWLEAKDVFLQMAVISKDNAEHQKPCNIHFTSVRDNMVVRDRMDNGDVLPPYVNMHSKPFWELFPKEQLVYITPDAPALQEVSEDDIFVMPGRILIQRNSVGNGKVLQHLDIRRASLPLQQFYL